MTKKITIGKTTLKIYDPIFKQKIMCFFNCDEANYVAFQKRLGVSNLDGYDPNNIAFTTHISAEGEPNTYVIWLKHFDWTIDDQASLIHELIHVVVRIWEANNIKFIPETQEFFAHSVDQLYSLIAAKLLKVK